MLTTAKNYGLYESLHVLLWLCDLLNAVQMQMAIENESGGKQQSSISSFAR